MDKLQQAKKKNSLVIYVTILVEMERVTWEGTCEFHPDVRIFIGGWAFFHSISNFSMTHFWHYSGSSPTEYLDNRLAPSTRPDRLFAGRLHILLHQYQYIGTIPRRSLREPRVHTKSKWWTRYLLNHTIITRWLVFVHAGRCFWKRMERSAAPSKFQFIRLRKCFVIRDMPFHSFAI